MTEVERDEAYVSIGVAAWQVWRAIAAWCALALLLRVAVGFPGTGVIGGFGLVVFVGGVAAMVWRGHEIVRHRHERLRGLPRV